jgi:hypothetical protein
VGAVILTSWPPGGQAPKWAVLAGYAMRGRRMLLTGPFLFAATLALVVPALKGRKAALGGVILLTAAELGAYGMSFVNTGRPDTFESIVEGESNMLPRERGFSRVERPLLTDIRPAMAGYYQVTGYAGLPPAKALDYTRDEALRLACARWKVVPIGAKRHGHYAKWRAVEVTGPMLRVRLVANAIKCAKPADMLPLIDITTTALVGKDLGLESSAPGTATISRDLPGDIAVAVDAPSRQLLVLSESYHGGWTASMDGVSAPVLPVYGDFLGVVVDKGQHAVAFEFLPRDLWWGKRISIIGLVLAGLLFAAMRQVFRGARLDSPATTRH